MDATWIRATREQPCPVCGKPDWCTGLSDGSLYLCMRVGDGAIQVARNGGFIHRRSGARRDRRSLRQITHHRLSEPELHQLIARYDDALDRRRLLRYGDTIGVSSSNLLWLGMGWAPEYQCFSLPMYDGRRRPVGIHLRRPDGLKFAVPGSSQGLFIPPWMDGVKRLLITEGATDCAAMLDLEFCAIGRPSCQGGVKLVIDAMIHYRPCEAVIVADADAPGLRGAQALASVLVAYVPTVKMIFPPGCKDAREWKRQGATHADITAAIDAAIPLRIKARGTAGGAQ